MIKGSVHQEDITGGWQSEKPGHSSRSALPCLPRQLPPPFLTLHVCRGSPSSPVLPSRKSPVVSPPVGIQRWVTCWALLGAPCPTHQMPPPPILCTWAVPPLGLVKTHILTSSSGRLSCPPSHEEAVRASPMTLPGHDLRMTPEVTGRLPPGRGPSIVPASFTQLC